jgi:4-aminobutyrate aminotransferase-like enzyme
VSVPTVLHRAIPYANAVALSPPLTITDEEIDELVDAFGAALSDAPVST